MPSVGMRRNTRVFGARVLRSGRKIWPGAGVGEDWIGLLGNSTSGGGGDVAVQSKEIGLWNDDIVLKEEESGDFANEEEEDTREPDGRPMGSNDDASVDKMWGAVYRRKRKRVVNIKGSSHSYVDSREQMVDRMFGKRFYRKHCRKRLRRNPIEEVTDLDTSFGFVVCGLILESSCGSSWFSCFINSVLRYMRRFRVRLDQLSAFLSSQPISDVFFSHGVRFLQDSSSIKGNGVCKIYDSRYSMPSFSLHFSAVPSLFMHLHSTLLLRSGFLPNAFVNYTNSHEANADEMTTSEFHMVNQMIDDDDQPSCIPSGEDQSLKLTLNRNVISTSKLPGKTILLRNRCIKKKRRSSLRPHRGCNKKYSSLGLRTKAKHTLDADLFLDQGRIPLSPLPSNRLISSKPTEKNLRTNIKELKSFILGSVNDLKTLSCLANILVIESDKGYREEGAIIKLETSSLNHWFLSVNRESTRSYTLKPQSVMRPYSCNRFTHAIIWKDDRSNGWMLEFTNRKDWFVFKELHRECLNRNLQAPQVENIIPVPVVREVPGYDDHVSVPFERPSDSYISWKDDEVTRALENGSYEMDVDDEQWLKKFNDVAVGDIVLVDSFEKIMFEFEKGLFCSPEEYSDPKSAVDLCVNLERREVLEAVHSYWFEKRKQKCSALVKVFQCYQPRRTQLLPRAFLRKKRSSKRLARRTGRGKSHNFLKALLAEQNKPVNDESALVKVREAKAAASRSEESAILKRQKAQELMLTAELATYKAAMAIRIAEAAQVSESPDTVASYFFLD